MFVTNPFSHIDLVSTAVMQGWLVLMVLLVIGGTLLDVIHKKSAKYFFQLEQEQKKLAKREVSSSERTGLLVKTITNEVLTSSEFENPKRRLSHLLTMYGFVLLAVATAVMLFAYGGDKDTPALWPLLWHLGAIMLAIGTLWFWFFIRVDVFSEGNKPIDYKQRDIFVVALITTSIFALLWSLFQSAGSAFLGNLFFVLFIASATFLFSTILWSKFAHMFFKPAAAYQKKLAWADGSREKLPDIPDLSSPETHKRFPDIPKYMGKNPPNMGLGIKREPPNHY